VSELEALRKQVAALQARVAMLEARSPETDCYSRIPTPQPFFASPPAPQPMRIGGVAPHIVRWLPSLGPLLFLVALCIFAPGLVHKPVMEMTFADLLVLILVGGMLLRR
jgi:hypothetical protein